LTFFDIGLQDMMTTGCPDGVWGQVQRSSQSRKQGGTRAGAAAADGRA